MVHGSCFMSGDVRPLVYIAGVFRLQHLFGSILARVNK